jgi:hypothetical protein
MATLSELRTQVRDRIDEATAKFWTDTQINSWINEGARDLARRGEVLQTRDEITSIAGTQEYTLPSDVVRVYRVEYEDSSQTIVPLEYRDFNNMDSVWWSRQATTESTRPFWFTMWGYPPDLKIIVYPTPANSDEILRVFYYSVPATVSGDEDPIAVPTGWEDAIVLYAEYVALRKDGDARWQEAKAIYEEKVSQLIDVTRRWSDQAGAVTAQTSFLPGWLVGGEW